MHPILTDRRLLALHLAIWVITGQLLALLVHTLFAVSWMAAIAFGVPMGLLGGMCALSAWYVSHAAPANRTDRIRPIATWLLASVVVGVLWSLAGQVWWHAVDEAWHLAQLDVPQEAGLFALLKGLGGMGYMLAVAAYRVGHAFETTTAATRRALQSEVAQREAELRALRAQLDPHFLFNSLNSISGLIGADPAKAREMCQMLADFLRQSLRVTETATIPLAREVGLSEQYLKVEQVRFGSRLKAELRVAPDTTDISVPALLLQPLVENAVRHGIATIVEGGTITIETRRVGGQAVVTIANPRDADARVRGTGLGLDIVRRRLHAAFGDRATLTVSPEPELFRAQITLPVEERS